MAQVVITKTQFQSTLTQLLEKDDKDCKLLVDVYNEVRTCAEDSLLVRENILKFDSKFFESVKQGLVDLKKTDRPILVIGETSAGKSSFLNLLIGRKILPELAAPCTHCVCSIKKGEKLEARVSSFDDSTPNNVQVISGDGITDEKFQQTLENLVNQENCEESLDRCIDIFVPSTILEGNVHLVDTPGFGESEKVTKSLLKYLPNALGIIFILNSTVSLGIADDRGALILDEIKQLVNDRKLPAFDPSRVVFIANKWDQISVKERNNHRMKIIQRLETFWPEFREDQLQQLSVSCVLDAQDNKSYQDSYKSVITDYKAVLDKIRDTVESCANARSIVHRRYLEKVLEHMKTFTDASINFFALSVEDKHKKMESLKTLVCELESTYKKGKQRVKDLAGDIQTGIVQDVYGYLNDVENRKAIFQWKSNGMPNGNDYSKVKAEARVVIRKFISEAIFSRTAMSQSAIESLESKLAEFMIEIKDNQEKIERLLKSTDDRVKIQGLDRETRQTPDVQDEGLNKAAIATIALTSPLWIPLGLAGLVTVLPVAAAVDFARGKMKILRYRNNRKEHLEKWTGKVLREEYSEFRLKYIIFESFNDKMNEDMDTVGTLIEEHKNILLHLDENMQTEVVPHGYTEMRNMCFRMNEIFSKIQQL
ncbi:uncharacterized protein LOC132548169 [Ylistrum balloti]|uniref:uncharacterized protein LOC132548169 n=1 Tax=Ylistrum balloti TaxID=509963 RepID=UPI002905D6B3|nr:uncharacterized protein LOC132548169 [Ylistrum balloti]